MEAGRTSYITLFLLYERVVLHIRRNQIDQAIDLLKKYFIENQYQLVYEDFIVEQYNTTFIEPL